MTVLALHQASVSYKGTSILEDVSFSITSGRMIGLLGPNGAGKTTAVRALLGLQPLTEGRATLDGRDVASMTPKQRAALVAYLPQSRTMAWPIGVREVVGLGRFALRDDLGRPSSADGVAIEAALRDCDLIHLANRSITTLSGGEMARVHIARALTAQTQALVVDEPTNALDPRHSFDILARLQARAQGGAAVLVILHDLSAAARFCDEIILLDSGKCIGQGPPRAILSPDNLAEVYSIEARWRGDDLYIIGPTPA
jgi:iron complex transport system ATP-binding protein